jgi:hypothetical protein
LRDDMTENGTINDIANGASRRSARYARYGYSYALEAETV